MNQTVGDGYSALLFLRRPPKLGSQARKGRELEVDLIEALVAKQRTSTQPILLVPQTFVWSKQAATASPSLLDLLFGPVQWPGRVRVLFQFLLNYRDAKLRSGEPFNLQDFLEKNPDLSDSEAADKVRYALLRRMERDRAVVLGPMKKTTARIQDELLRSPRVRAHIERFAGEKGISYVKAEKVARKQLEHLCAKQSLFVVDLAHRFLTWVWSKMYDGVDFDKAGLERVREAALDSSLVLLPSHKSHIDYLVLSDMLYGNGMMAPLIAAGDNLSFWPIGVLLRRGGAFFIRRSFHDDTLYPVLVEAYMRKLIAEGFTVEFFLEGGRSRIGKPLPPKYGLLSMVFESASKLRGTKVKLVPISIGYERIIEERSFVHELAGGDKQSENMGDLIKSSSILRSKWGRLYVQFGEIIDFDEFKKRRCSDRAASSSSVDEINPDQQRNAVRALAHKVMYSINEVTVVTPAALVATALLSHQKRGMTRASLLTACEDLLATLDVMQARIAHQLRIGDGRIREDTIDEALHLFLDARLIIAHDTGPEPIYTIRFRAPHRPRVLPEHDHSLLRAPGVDLRRAPGRHGGVGRHRAPQRPRSAAVASLQARVHVPNRRDVRRDLPGRAARHGSRTARSSSETDTRKPPRARCGIGSSDTPRCSRPFSKATSSLCAAPKSSSTVRFPRKTGTSAPSRSGSRCTSPARSSAVSRSRSSSSKPPSRRCRTISSFR